LSDGALICCRIELTRTEQQIQRAVVQHIRARGVPGLFAFHVPNGGYRTRLEGAVLKGMGVVAGVPDLILLHAGRTFGLELKVDGNKPTPAQSDTMAKMEQAGATVAHAQGLDAALAQLEVWGLLRGRAA
jgi:hypothetical protein